MPKLVPTSIVFSIVVLSGVIDGLWTDRWLVAKEMHTAVDRLAAIPMALGDWDGCARELDSRTLALGEISGYARRQYVNRRTGSTLSLLIVCGRPGPVSVHLPDACYGGAGYEEVGERAKYSVTGPPPADFWIYRFHRPNAAVPVQLRVFCSWGADGAWRAVATPRVQFAHHAFLYKMYIIRELSKADEPLEEDPALDFIHLLLPELQKALFPTVGTTRSVGTTVRTPPDPSPWATWLSQATAHAS
jgi:hypothetical protein